MVEKGITDLEQAVARRAKDLLDLGNARLSSAYYYAHLPLCVVDSVFSIGVRYAGVRCTVARWCNRQKWNAFRAHGSDFPSKKDQKTMKNFLAALPADPDKAAALFGNRQRTSSRSGILKAEAARRFAQVLAEHRIDVFQDLANSSEGELEELERAIRMLPGQTSGLSFDYFRMLAGRDDLVKADRWIVRFVKAAVGRPIAPREAGNAVKEAARQLARCLPHVTPRLLDHAIWSHGTGKRRNEGGVASACPPLPR